MIFAVVARAAPAVKAIECRGFGDRVLERGAIRKACLLVRLDSNGGTAAGRVALTLANGYDGGVTIRIDVKTVVSAFLDGERHVGCVDFVYLAAEQLADVQIQRALVQFDLHVLTGNVGQCQAALITHAEQASAHVEFGLGLFVGPDVVGIRERAVLRPGNPVSRALGLNRN
jgi:hypothetical protein